MVYILYAIMQSTPCENWTTVKTRFFQQPMKGVETGVCQNKIWRHMYTRWQWYFKQKRHSL